MCGCGCCEGALLGTWWNWVVGMRTPVSWGLHLCQGHSTPNRPHSKARDCRVPWPPCTRALHPAHNSLLPSPHPAPPSPKISSTAPGAALLDLLESAGPAAAPSSAPSTNGDAAAAAAAAHRAPHAASRLGAAATIFLQSVGSALLAAASYPVSAAAWASGGLLGPLQPAELAFHVEESELDAPRAGVSSSIPGPEPGSAAATGVGMLGAQSTTSGGVDVSPKSPRAAGVIGWAAVAAIGLAAAAASAAPSARHHVLRHQAARVDVQAAAVAPADARQARRQRVLAPGAATAAGAAAAGARQEAAADVAPRVLDEAAARQLLVAWNSARQAALGPAHDELGLDRVMTGPLLQSWRQQAVQCALHTE